MGTAGRQAGSADTQEQSEANRRANAQKQGEANSRTDAQSREAGRGAEAEKPREAGGRTDAEKPREAGRGAEAEKRSGSGERGGRRGRQAEAARNDIRLLEAAHEVFTTQGFDAPVSAIARRAGVGMGSLYRRYRTKEELLQRLCVIAVERVVEAAERGLAEQDPWEGLCLYVRRCVAARSGALGPVAGTIEVTDEMLRVTRQAMELAGGLIARAHEAGVLRSDVTTLDVSLLMEQFSRPAPKPPTAEDRHVRDRLLAIALDGLRAPGATPLPGDPPAMDWYEGRWTAGS
jgi:AcrR family transcriptional regulator